jgi:superfamily II DNA or RNA helicase
MKVSILRSCQILALDTCDSNNKGILRMCCGSGKTLVEVKLCLQERVSCLIAPRNALLSQHIQTFKDVLGYKGKDDLLSFETKTVQVITINCESDIAVVKVKPNKKVCFVINNSSLEKLPLTPDIVVVDEAHTHKNAIKRTGKLLQAKRRYFFTATPQEMDDTEFYGETIYRFDYDEAVVLDYVCPFKIVPIWNNTCVVQDLKEKMDKYSLTHNIHFYETVNRGENNKNVCLNDVPLRKFKNGQKITDKTKNREVVLKNFKESGGHLLSCKTISYGIDIPECDSVYLSYVGNSIPDLVQKVMRAIRKNPKKPGKIAYVFVNLDIPEPMVDNSDSDDDTVDITEEVKEMQQQLVFKICTMLTEGIDIDILNSYYPYNKRVIEKLQSENEKLESIKNDIETQIRGQSEIETASEEKHWYGGSAEELKLTYQDICKQQHASEDVVEHLKEEDKNESKRCKFEDFFDDHQMKVWYTTGEIKCDITLSNEEKWQETADKLIIFVETHKKFPSPNSKDKIERALGAWCNTQRSKYRGRADGRSLTDFEIDFLESIPGWFWNVDEVWQENANTIRKFVETRKKLPSEKIRNEAEQKLGRWCSKQRRNYHGKGKGRKLTQEQTEFLESIPGWFWEKDLDKKWQNIRDKLKAFVEKNKKLPSKSLKNKPENTLYNWCNIQRGKNRGTANGTCKLTKEQITC